MAAGAHSKLLPEPTISRLPIYQRIAREGSRRGFEQIDSSTLGRLAGVAPATVRRDLSSLGPMGTRGAGYDIDQLVARIDEVLGHDYRYDVILVGAGNLGRALLNSPNFLITGARLVGIYDKDPAVVGTDVAGLTVGDIDGPLMPATLAVLCVPPDAAQAAADRLIACDVHAILNFAPQVIAHPIGVAVRYVDFSIEMQILAYHLTNGSGPLGGGVLHTLGVTRPIPNAS
jgi:redox-sensing transcriptional repressor